MPCHHRPAAQPIPAADPTCIAGHVACPVCGKTLPEAFLNIHLDECLQQESRRGGSEAAPTLASTSTAPIDLTREPAALKVRGDAWKRCVVQQGVCWQVPPKMSFRMMNDKTVRDTLRKYGLASQGKKEVGQGLLLHSIVCT